MAEINQTKALIWLSITGATAKRLNLMLRESTALELWDNAHNNPKLEKHLGKNYQTALKYHNADLLDEIIQKITNKGASILTISDPDYPVYLNQPEVSPPIVLYYRGNLNVLKKPCVAIVGTRTSSPYGASIAQSLARDFALAGATVVSGMASGIDENAHKSALEVGSTVAVLGGGFEKITAYSRPLFEKILASDGLVVSEYHPNFTPTRYTFPERNRIISGLSQAIVVVEAGKKSGALITADFALEQNRDVFAVPGNITNANSYGCNELIKNGEAQILTSYKDVLTNILPNSSQDNKKQLSISLDFFEEKIYNLLSNGQMHFNDIMEKADLQPPQIMKILTDLELKGIITRLAGNYYSVILK